MMTGNRRRDENKVCKLKLFNVCYGQNMIDAGRGPGYLIPIGFLYDYILIELTFYGYHLILI